ncbi:MAG: hypothetical protein ACMUIP_04935 [bacterium]
MGREQTVVDQCHVASIIKRYYCSNALQRLYKEYLHPIFNKNTSQTQQKSSAKQFAPFVLASIYAQKESFLDLLSYFPAEVRQILYYLVWEGGKHNIKKFEQALKIEIKEPIKKHNYNIPSQNIKSSYLLFTFEYKYSWWEKNDAYTYYFFLPDDLRKLFKAYLPFPEEGTLQPLDSIKQTTFLYENNDRILSQIELLFHSIKHGNLKFSKSTDTLLKSSLKHIADSCDIEEFYPETRKDLHYMRTKLLINFLLESLDKKITNPLSFLHELFNEFFYHSETNHYACYSLLHHLKVKSGYYLYPNNDNEKKIRQSLLNLLKKIPISQWISIDNLMKYCWYSDIYLEVITQKSAHSKLYYKKKYSSGSYHYGYDNVYISEKTYKDAIIEPFLKAILFLFSSFGLLDIAYDYPVNSILQEKEHPYLSVFDGLRYFKLTELGAYILGINKNYTVPVTKKEATIILDEKRLIITIQGEDVLKKITLEKIANKISASCYKVDYNSFLKQCMSKDDIENRIQLFREQICATPPKIWELFLNEVQRKCNPLTIDTRISAYKIKESKELISLIAKDEILKKYALKAENYYILIEKRNIFKVKKRLAEFGYFIDTL